MICPSCGKKTIFDLKRCPACGCDPWAKPGEALAAGLGEERTESRLRDQGRRVLLWFTARPKLSFVFVLLGVCQILLAGGSFVSGSGAAGVRALGFLDWLWALAMTVLPGLLLLAVGEGISHLSAIRDALNRDR